MKELENELCTSSFSSSNLELAVKKGISISKNASQLWISGDYNDKQRLQYTIYPEGIWYNKQTNTVRTPRVNSLFSVISCLSWVSAKNKNGQSSKIGQNSHWVAPTRIELVSKV